MPRRTGNRRNQRLAQPHERSPREGCRPKHPQRLHLHLRQPRPVCTVTAAMIVLRGRAQTTTNWRVCCESCTLTSRCTGRTTPSTPMPATMWACTTALKAVLVKHTGSFKKQETSMVICTVRTTTKRWKPGIAPPNVSSRLTLRHRPRLRRHLPGTGQLLRQQPPGTVRQWRSILTRMRMRTRTMTSRMTVVMTDSTPVDTDRAGTLMHTASRPARRHLLGVARTLPGGPA